ncbi:MAG: hypothetical protein J07HR59_01846 [Halorubrum sp. J07HR59]|jgi:hypothetical protein|nr:MAG: hypothetical protein J07HR59_01846 [Halorubrum sp. J07HR59]
MHGVSVRGLRVVAGIVALSVAGVHLLHPSHGVPGLVQWLEIGFIGDPRPLLFVTAGFLILSGVGVGYFGIYRQTVYLGGIAICLGFLGGFAVWHTVLDHGAFWPYIEPQGHGGAPLVVMYEHLRIDRLLLISKLLESTLVVLLTVLYRIDR